MNCLEKYRSRLVRDLNHNLRLVYAAPDETAVHDFRVGIKRLTALYYFLGEIEPDLDTQTLLKPYRALFKAVGGIRDVHIAMSLLRGLDGADTDKVDTVCNRLRALAQRDYRRFRRNAAASGRISIRVPTLKSIAISERAILRHKPVMLDRLIKKIVQTDTIMTARQWHKKRILLKRYHHVLDAFHFCPGHSFDDSELKQIRMLEQLLGDWHDRVVTAEMIQALPGSDEATAELVAIMNRQDKMLLGAARIYLRKYALWHLRRSSGPT